MGRSLNATAASGALTVQAFVGDGCTLLAFDLKQGSAISPASPSRARRPTVRENIF